MTGKTWIARLQHLVSTVMAASPRPLEGGARVTTHVVAAALGTLYLYTAGFGVFSAESHRAIFLGGTQALVFLWFPARGTSPRSRFSVPDAVLALAAALTAAYFIWEYPSLVRRAGLATPADVTLGALAILLGLEAARRVVGPIVPLVAIVGLLFAWREIAPYLPGAVAHRGFTAERIVTSLYMSVEGLFGVVTYTFATHVFLFVVFGAFLERSGVGRFFIDLPYSLMGRSPGGGGKVAVGASALLGMVTGSPTANTAAMGNFTIPLMKRTGYAPHVAAGIETGASIGSQFLPPVMGAAAFFMVEFTGIPYIEVVKLAAIPALIYYVGVMAMVHFQARRDGMQGASANELPDWRRVFVQGWYLALPLVVLLAQLARGHSTGVAAFWGTLTAVAVSWVRPENRMRAAQIWTALVVGSRNTLMIASVAASIGIIVGIIGLTGLGLRFSGIMLSLTGDSLLLAMLIVALTATILGCGAPITATYVILAVLVPPALAKLGVSVAAAHLTLIWFSQLSSITPPVCLVVYAAAAIAQADPFRASYHALKFSAFLIVMPFLFVYTPLLESGSSWLGVLAAATATIAAVTFAATLQGFFARRSTWPETVLLGAGTLGLFDGRPAVNAVGLVLVVGVYLYQRRTAVIAREWNRESSPPLPASTAPRPGAPEW
jgi:TRAP transporter 4TM/12TM fusion protein